MSLTKSNQRKASLATISFLIVASLAALPGLAPTAHAEQLACDDRGCIVMDPNPGDPIETPNVGTECESDCVSGPVELKELSDTDPEEVVPAITVWTLRCVFETSIGDPAIIIVSTEKACPLNMNLDEDESSSSTFGPIENDKEVVDGKVGTLTTGNCRITGNLLIAGIGIEDMDVPYPCASFEP